VTTSTVATPRTFTAETVGGGLVALSAEPYPRSPHLFRYRWWCDCDAVEQRWHRDCDFDGAVKAAREHAEHCTFDAVADLAREVAEIKATAADLTGAQRSAIAAAN
jgi:hypothetical protein